MAGAFSVIMDLIGLAGTADGNSDITELTRALNSTKSISERAKKSIFVYPVLFSSGMADITIDYTISKFLEVQYGIFTLMTVGLNPSVENGDISEYLKTISAESIEGMKYSIKSVSGIESSTWFDYFSTENKEFFDEYRFSTEGGLFDKFKKPQPGDTVIESMFNDDGDVVSEKEMKDANKNSKVNSSRESGRTREDDVVDPFTLESSDGRATLDPNILEKKIGKAAPTIISLDIKIKGYQNSFKVPIALKASPHFLRSQDLAALFDSAIEDKRLLTRLVRLTSGEISFFKDFMFNMDRIKRDQELYKTFGQHPWYQQFTERKEKNAAKRVGIIASVLSGKGKSLVSASSSNYLPTASIIMTREELEQSSKMKYGFLLKNDKIIWSVLNHLGLLCMGIYNSDTEIVNFYFNGFKKPMAMRVADLKAGEKKDSEDKMTDLMSLMLKRGIM
ncbi:MAG: hypothetical protein ACRC5M_04635 [Anaeroplasmataceae bacterium]